MMFVTDYNPDDLVAKVTELLVATHDAADPEIDRSVPEVLSLLRNKLSMDVIFVSQFVDGKRVFRHVDQDQGAEVIETGGSDPLEDSWCKQVVEGRLPQFIQDAGKQPETAAQLDKLAFPIGTHISVPIVLKGGEVYGTLCTFSFRPKEINGHDALTVLQLTAQLTAMKIEEGERSGLSR